MRVYLSTTLAGLAAARDAGGFEVNPVGVHAVTPELREWYLSEDLEELEYAALNRAAQSALELLAAEPDSPRRRVVVAAEVPDADVVADSVAGLSAVRISTAVRLADAAAVHVDEEDAAADVAAAVGALAAARAGDTGAQVLVDGAEEHELLWFDMRELDDLLG